MKKIVISLSVFLALGYTGQACAMDEKKPAGVQDTLGQWYESARKGLGQAREWLTKGEGLGYYAPGLAQGLAASGEFMLTGDKARAAEGLARGLYLGASGHLAPKLVRMGYDYPKLAPALASAAPAFLASNLYAIRNQPWQDLLKRVNLWDNVEKLARYGVTPKNLIPYGLLGYGVPAVAKSVAANPLPWKGAAAVTAGPWISYMISRYGITADLLHTFLDNNPIIANVVERLLLGGAAPAVVFSILAYTYRDKIAELLKSAGEKIKSGREG